MKSRKLDDMTECARSSRPASATPLRACVLLWRVPQEVPMATSGTKSTSKASASRKASSSKRKNTGAQTTTDHAVIRRWVEDRGGFPADGKADTQEE